MSTMKLTESKEVQLPARLVHLVRSHKAPEGPTISLCGYVSNADGNDSPATSFAGRCPLCVLVAEENGWAVGFGRA